MILIIGAGLSGLLTGYLLKKRGIPFKIIEARNRIGGRINTVYGTNKTPVEMGATWFTDQHRNLISLLEELELEYFEQHMDRTVFYQPSAALPTQTVQIPGQNPSYRISGGTSNLIHALYQELDENEVLLNQTVKEIKFHLNSVQVHAEDIIEGTRIVLALPPKLWAENILFEPHLPIKLMNIAKQTHTWMEDSIKIALTYTHPFWEAENLPSTLFSNDGPITELYDHCNHKRSKYALCGFINSSFKSLTYTKRRERVINQLINVFGARAEEFTQYEECLWSSEKDTFQASEVALHPHQNNGNPIFNTSYFNDKLLISSAESALEFPGYMDGAVLSAKVTVEKIMKTQ